MNSEKSAIKEKLMEYYGDFFTEEYCECICEELEPLLERSSPYRKPLLEWKNGKSVITEVSVPKVDSEGDADGSWSLGELAMRLEPLHPNVPVAALLLFLSEQTPVTLSAVMAVAEECCFADPVLIEQENRQCTCAFLDEESCEWVFLTETTRPEELREYQLWQVLLQVPALAFPVSYDFEPGVSVQLWEDGLYHIVPPES